MNAPLQSASRPRVMVLDDEPGIAEIFVELLRMEGVEAYAVCSGESALALLGRVLPDVLFVDCLMPEMSGETFLAELERRLPDVRRQTLIVGLSGLDNEAPTARRFAARVDRLEAKPTDLDVFVDVYRRSLVAARRLK